MREVTLANMSDFRTFFPPFTKMNKQEYISQRLAEDDIEESKLVSLL